MENKFVYNSPVIVPTATSYRINKNNDSIIIDFIGYVNNNEVNVVSSIFLDKNMITKFISELKKIQEDNFSKWPFYLVSQTIKK